MRRPHIRRVAGGMALAMALGACSLAEATDALDEQTFVSITDVREAASEGWHDSIEAHGRTVTIALDSIAIPPVDAMPILKVRQAAYREDAPFDQYDESYPSGRCVSAVAGTPGYEAYPPGAGQQPSEWLYGKDIDWNARAEAHPLSASDVRGLLLDKLDAFYGPGTAGLFTEGSLCLNSRVYYADKFTGELTDEPFSQTGDYQLSMRQLMRGVPILTAVILPEMRERPWLSTESTIYLTDADNYGFNLAVIEEAEVVVDDVPLRAFVDVKAALAALVEAGSLRTVESLSLGYAVYADAEDSTLFWLMPTWVAEGEYYESPTAENPFLEEPWASDPMSRGLRPVHTVTADAQSLTPTDPLAETMWTGGYMGETPTEESILRWTDVGR